jgi:SAM-dependent methyltransferase
MVDTDSGRAYGTHVADLKARLGKDEALRQAIGGEFEAVGKLEYFLLRSLGLVDGHFIVDVGCGSGRLACQMAHFPGISYLGTDVVQSLLDFAKAITKRPDWHFLLTEGTTIPCPADTADFVSFFSVFTHLLHEESFRYMKEASRVLKPGGYLVFSFIEFRVSSHWGIFFSSLADHVAGRHLNQFIDRDAINVWAAHSNFEVVAVYDGDKPHIPIPEEIRWKNGNVMGSLGNLGQSVAVLRKMQLA